MVERILARDVSRETFLQLSLIKDVISGCDYRVCGRVKASFVVLRVLVCKPSVIEEILNTDCWMAKCIK